MATTSKQDIVDGDWMWVRFSDTEKIRWTPLGNDTYELHILVRDFSRTNGDRNANRIDQSTEHHQMAVENLPDVEGYATADVFVKHPTKNIWKM